MTDEGKGVVGTDVVGVTVNIGGGRLKSRKRRTLLAGMMMMMNNRGVDVVWELILPLNGVDTGTG